MNDGGWTEANVVAAAVRILGGAQKVADSLGVSRSQVYRWIKARTMARATYFYVAKLASLSGIETGFLGGDGSVPVANGGKAPPGKAAHGSKERLTATPPIRKTRVRGSRQEERPIGIRQSANGKTKVSWQEEPDRPNGGGGEELARIDVQKGGIHQNCLVQSTSVAPGGGDHYGRRRTLRTKGQEESREHQS